MQLEKLNNIGVSSFLTVLKRLGPKNKAPLSFPINGWTLAIDIPASTPNLNKTLDLLDDEICSAGGRIYLAKDSRQSSQMFKDTYLELNEWRKIKDELDPRGVFTSDLAKRLGI